MAEREAVGTMVAMPLEECGRRKARGRFRRRERVWGGATVAFRAAESRCRGATMAFCNTE